MKKIFLISFVLLLSFIAFGQEGYQPNRNLLEVPLIVKTGPGGSSTDSSFYFKSSSGAPYLHWYGTDGDNFSIGINTSDGLVFSGVSGYTFGNAPFDVGATVAGIDSFTLTVVTDTLVISGIATGDIFAFTEYCPDYSTAIDTVTFSYRAKTDTVFVTRVPCTASGGALKSAGLYSYIRLK